MADFQYTQATICTADWTGSEPEPKTTDQSAGVLLFPNANISDVLMAEWSLFDGESELQRGRHSAHGDQSDQLPRPLDTAW